MSSDFIISIATNGIVSRVVFFFREGGGDVRNKNTVCKTNCIYFSHKYTSTCRSCLQFQYRFNSNHIYTFIYLFVISEGKMNRELKNYIA